MFITKLSSFQLFSVHCKLWVGQFEWMVAFHCWEQLTVHCHFAVQIIAAAHHHADRTEWIDISSLPLILAVPARLCMFTQVDTHACCGERVALLFPSTGNQKKERRSRMVSARLTPRGFRGAVEAFVLLRPSSMCSFFICKSKLTAAQCYAHPALSVLNEFHRRIGRWQITSSRRARQQCVAKSRNWL